MYNVWRCVIKNEIEISINWYRLDLNAYSWIQMQSGEIGRENLYQNGISDI